jgi:hypothetical protein
MMEHTKEPWSLGKWIDDQERYIDAIQGDADLNFSKWEGLAVVFGSDDFSGGHEKCEANARRIVACVNACKGLSTEAIETFGESIPGGMVFYLEKANKDRDAALAMVRELVNWGINIESDPMHTLRIQQIWTFHELKNKAGALS